MRRMPMAMGRRVKLCALILLLGTVTLGVHRVYLANSRGYETVQPQERSQRVQPRDQSQPVQPQDRSQPVQPQDQRLPAQPEDQSQPVNQHEMIRSEIQSQPRQAPQAPQSGATTGSKGTCTLLLQNGQMHSQIPQYVLLVVEGRCCVYWSNCMVKLCG